MLLSIACLTAAAQKPTIINDPKAKVRNITGSFTKVSVSSGIELYLSQSNETALAISVSDDKYESRVKTDVKNGVLIIKYDNNGINWTNDKKRKIKAYLSCRTLERIDASSGSLVRIENEFSAPAMALSVSSGARFTGKLQTKALTADVSSGGEIEMSGVAVTSKLQASSGASLNGYLLTTKDCTANASSGGSIKIAVEKEIKVSASSGGDIRYKGSPNLIKQNISSGGSVKQNT